MRVKILKDYKAGKKGEIKEVSFPGGDAQEYVDNGFIEIIKEKEKDDNVDLGIFEFKKYECKKCNTIITSQIVPKKCPACEGENFFLLNYNKDDIKLKVLAYFDKKQFGEGSEILVKIIEENNFIYTTKVDKAQEIFIYKNGIYVPEGESEIKSQLRTIMSENYSEWLAGQVLSKIKTDTFIDPEEFFKDREVYEIPVENGILDLKEIKLYDYSPDKIFFSKLPINYEKDLFPKQIDNFLKDVLSKPDDVDVFYEIAGFGLIKEYIWERAFMFVGNGRNGKSKTIELLKRLVGTRNCSSVPLSSLTPTSPFVQSLWKKYFNLAGDLSSSDLKETGMFKQLTGRDPVAANRKYKNTIEFCNYAKLIFACNELPRVYDYSDGFWDRWILLEFPYKFVNKETLENANKDEKKYYKLKDPEIINEITTKEEMSGFLNQAIIGLHRLLENKKFSYSSGTSEVKNKWIRKADSFMSFCLDNIEEEYDSKISKKELRSKYKKYCSEHKVKGASNKSIMVTLQELFGCEEGRIYDGTIQEYVWDGIKWKN